MTGKTHVVGGNVFALGSYILMKKTGLLVDSVWEPLQLGIILPYATWASTLPDLDQNNKNRVETNPVNTAIQDLFRVIQAGHRSVKSHVAPCIIVGVLCVMSILGKSFFNLNQISTNILFLVLTGLFCGLLSHLILDLCTSDGIVIAGKRIALVPKNPVFGTGTKYESIYRRICYVLSCLLLIMAFSAHIKGDTNSLSDSIALLEPCLAVGGTTINYTECDSANITSITLEDCSITDAYLTAADWSVNATVTTDGTSSSDYGDNVSINYSYESSTGCSYTSLKVLLLNNAGEVLGYGIGFVNDVPVGENVNSTMYAIAAPHSLDSLADMAMFSCPTLE